VLAAWSTVVAGGAVWLALLAPGLAGALTFGLLVIATLGDTRRTGREDAGSPCDRFLSSFWQPTRDGVQSQPTRPVLCLFSKPEQPPECVRTASTRMGVVGVRMYPEPTAGRCCIHRSGNASTDPASTTRHADRLFAQTNTSIRWFASAEPGIPADTRDTVCVRNHHARS
jgi:hypothetical protein